MGASGSCAGSTHIDHSFAAAVMTTRYGLRLATSVGGTLTGRGGDLILIDDPSSRPMPSLSPGARR